MNFRCRYPEDEERRGQYWLGVERAVLCPLPFHPMQFHPSPPPCNFTVALLIKRCSSFNSTRPSFPVFIAISHYVKFVASYCKGKRQVEVETCLQREKVTDCCVIVLRKGIEQEGRWGGGYQPVIVVMQVALWMTSVHSSECRKGKETIR